MVSVMAVPVPSLRSLVTSCAGGGPTSTGTSGAPGGSGSATATQGFPATDGSDAAVVVGLVGVRGRVVVAFDAVLLPPPPFRAKAATKAMTSTPAPIAPRRR